jgi:hypothetical protein
VDLSENEGGVGRYDQAFSENEIFNKKSFILYFTSIK